MSLTRTLKRAAATAAVLTAGSAAFLSPGAVAADNGDGTGTCVRYEICFGRDNPVSSIQKHFYYGATHGDYYWSGASSQKVQDSASTVLNSDESGTVYTYNYVSGVQRTEYIPRTSYWLFLEGTNNVNDGHKIV